VDLAALLSGEVETRLLPASVVPQLAVPTDALVGWMTSRLLRPKSSRVYNLMSEPPKIAGICDDDATTLITRRDDQELVFRERLRMYEDITRPVLAYYHYRNYYQIRGDRSPSYIFEEITGILEPMLSKNGASNPKLPGKP